MSHLSVAKFGGTSVANFEAMTSSANIVMADSNTRVVVLSASAGVTNYLVELANGCEKNRRDEILLAVRQIQYNIIENLENQEEVKAEVDKLLNHITSLAESASLATSAALSVTLKILSKSSGSETFANSSIMKWQWTGRLPPYLWSAR